MSETINNATDDHNEEEMPNELTEEEQRLQNMIVDNFWSRKVRDIPGQK